MLLFIVLTNLVCLLVPALTSAHLTTSENTAKVASYHVKRLSTPLKNLLHKRDAILFAGSPNASKILALNSTNGEIAETIPFEAAIAIPGDLTYFLIKGEMDQDYSATVEIWVHTVSDRRIGIFYGHLIQGIDMKIPSSIKSIDGEARLYMVVSGGYDVLVFEAYGTVHPPHALSKYFAPFQKEIKRWKVGTFPNFTDVPDNSGVHTLSNDASVDTSFSVE